MVGKEDNVAALTLKTISESCNKYGKEPTVVFIHTQGEREEMEKQIIANTSTHGEIKARVLFYNLLSIGLESELPEEIKWKYATLSNCFLAIDDETKAKEYHALFLKENPVEWEINTFEETRNDIIKFKEQ